MAMQAFKNMRPQQAAEANQSGEGSSMSFEQMIEKYKDEVAKALPKHMQGEVERIVRAAKTAYRLNPLLENCQPRSVFAAIIQASQLGLDISSHLGEAYLVPVKGREGSVCNLYIGYQGLIKLARNTGVISDIYAFEVREKDQCKARLGMHVDFEHIPYTLPNGFPASEEDRGEVVGYYAVAVYRDGLRKIKIMSRKKVEEIRDASQTYQAARRFNKKTPWDTHPTEMGLKTVLRQLCKELPRSAELAVAMAMDSLHESGQAQGLKLDEVASGTYAPPVVEQPDEPLDMSDAEVDAETREILAPARPSAEVRPIAAASGGTGTAPKTAAAERASEPAPAKASPSKEAPIVSPIPAPDEAQERQKLLHRALHSLQRAPSIEALDEIYLRAEATFEGAELEAVLREYKACKARLAETAL